MILKGIFIQNGFLKNGQLQVSSLTEEQVISLLKTMFLSNLKWSLNLSTFKIFKF